MLGPLSHLPPWAVLPALAVLVLVQVHQALVLVLVLVAQPQALAQQAVQLPVASGWALPRRLRGWRLLQPSVWR